MKTILKVFVLTPFLFISSCTNSSNPVGPSTTTPGSGKIFTGPSVDLGSQTIGTSGGTFTISKPGDSLNGFQITVPANGFAQPQMISVSYAPITSHELGSSINPISPLIKITCNGGYSADRITVKVPIKLPAGSFAMGFFYNETTGSIEPLPVAALDSTSITIATRHLSPADAQLGKGLFKTANPVWGSVFISHIAKSVLHNLPVISTGFTPGVDDWEFPNCGSYISPKGHCAGQSATAIWYYYEHKLKGEAGLYNRYDKVKADWFWPDNPRGYRFASTIQEDLSYWSLMNFVDETVAFYLPDVVFDSFIYSMYATGKPQMVGVRNRIEGVGHAMVVYKIDVFGGKLYVADPNYPGNATRVIEFVPGLMLGSFKPYSSALKVGEEGHNYDSFQYDAVTSLVDWSKISQRWTEFQNGTIGNDRFPTYSLTEIRNLTDFVDGLDTDLDSVKVINVSTVCPFSLPGTFNRQPIAAYDAQANLLDTAKTFGVLTLGLKPGDNTFGLYIQGIADDHGTYYLDFKWIEVHRHMTLTVASTEANGAPVSTSGTKGKLYTFVAKSARPVPKDGKVRYDWSFGDGTPVTSVNNDSTVTHTFAQDGSYTIDVGFYYDQTKINNVTASASIAPTSPVISSIVPSAAWVGDTVKIKGKNFGVDKTKGTVTFSIGVVATQIISWNDTTISVKVPQGTQTGPVTVTVNGVTSNAATLTIPTAASDLLAVAGGTFQMGYSPGPIGQSPGHAVTVGAFKIDKYEITYEKWTEVRTWGLTHGYTDLTSGQNGAAPTSANNPATMVSWYQIMRWCNARSEKDGLTPVYYTSNTLSTVYRTGVLDVAADQVKWTANGYRLPTEAEWEFAARGGKTGTNVYSGSNTLGDVAWYHDNSGNHTHQVGTKSPNELGLFDMTGNVYEWCWDFYGEYSSGAQTDPKGPTSGVNRIVRGGSYIDYDYGCPLVSRYAEYPSTSNAILGFRCVQH